MIEIVEEMIALGVEKEDAVRFSENHNEEVLRPKLKIMKEYKGDIYNPGGFLTIALAEDFKRSRKKRGKKNINKSWVVKLKRIPILLDGDPAETGEYIKCGDGQNPEWFVKSRFMNIYIPYDSISCIDDIVKPKVKYYDRDTDEYCIEVEKYGLMIFEDGEFNRIERTIV